MALIGAAAMAALIAREDRIYIGKVVFRPKAIGRRLGLTEMKSAFKRNELTPG